MTQKASQIVLPINPTTLFTTVVGALIVGFLYYLSDIPKDIDETKVNIETIRQNTEALRTDIDLQQAIIADHTKRIQTIEVTRFTDEDAKELSNSIIREIRNIMLPVVGKTERNEKDIGDLESDLKQLKDRIK